MVLIIIFFIFRLLTNNEWCVEEENDLKKNLTEIVLVIMSIIKFKRENALLPSTKIGRGA